MQIVYESKIFVFEINFEFRFIGRMTGVKCDINCCFAQALKYGISLNRKLFMVTDSLANLWQVQDGGRRYDN